MEAFEFSDRHEYDVDVRLLSPIRVGLARSREHRPGEGSIPLVWPTLSEADGIVLRLLAVGMDRFLESMRGFSDSIQQAADAMQKLDDLLWSIPMDDWEELPE